MVLAGKSLQERPGSTLFLQYIYDLPRDVICNVDIYAHDTTLFTRCDQASNL